jgi:hypothetical protein
MPMPWQRSVAATACAPATARPRRWHPCQEWKILNRSRHKTAELIARSVRAEEVSKDNGLKGVGFLARRALQWQRSASGPSSYFALRSQGSHDADI